MTILFSLHKDQGEDADPQAAAPPSVFITGPATRSAICKDRPTKSNVAGMMGEGRVPYKRELFDRTSAALCSLGVFKGSAVGGRYLSAAEVINAGPSLSVITLFNKKLAESISIKARQLRQCLSYAPFLWNFSTFLQYAGGLQPVLADRASAVQPYFGVTQKF